MADSDGEDANFVGFLESHEQKRADVRAHTVKSAHADSDSSDSSDSDSEDAVNGTGPRVNWETDAGATGFKPKVVRSAMECVRLYTLPSAAGEQPESSSEPRACGLRSPWRGQRASAASSATTCAARTPRCTTSASPTAASTCQHAGQEL